MTLHIIIETTYQSHLWQLFFWDCSDHTCFRHYPLIALPLPHSNLSLYTTSFPLPSGLRISTLLTGWAYNSFLWYCHSSYGYIRQVPCRLFRLPLCALILFRSLRQLLCCAFTVHICFAYICCQLLTGTYICLHCYIVQPFGLSPFL